MYQKPLIKADAISIPSESAEKLRLLIGDMRASTGLSQKEFAQQYYGGTQSCQARYESGAMLPNRARAQLIMGAVSRQEATEFENLLIRARLERAANMERLGNRLAAGMERSEMPVVFAEETLRRSNNPEAWAARDDLPKWSDCVKPVCHRGQYLHAARQVLGLTGETVSNGEGAHFATVLKAERSDRGQATPQLAGYYQQQLETQGNASLFDPSVYDNLPKAPAMHR